jgi:hypothetical protein
MELIDTQKNDLSNEECLDNYLINIEINYSAVQLKMKSNNIFILIKDLSEGENLTFLSKITRESDHFSIYPSELSFAIQDYLLHIGPIDSFVYKFSLNLDLINKDFLEKYLLDFQAQIEYLVRIKRGLKSS